MATEKPVDVLAAAGDLFCQLTGRLGLTSVEFHQMQSYGWQRIPFSIIERALTEAVDKTRPERRPKARIHWYRLDVDDAYQAWKRAVGPQ